MPVFVNSEGFRIFYAHVPKTGGTYIEDFFRANGFECHYRATGLRASGTRIAPKHYHREIFEQILDLDAFDWKFLTVRHPLDRLVSEYRDKIDGKRRRSLREWLSSIEPRLERDPSVRTNHLRPQVDFFRSGLEIAKMEEGFDAAWAEGIERRFGLKFRVREVERRRSSQDVSAPPLTPQDISAAKAFCERHYLEDFEVFGYDPDHCKTLGHRSREGGMSVGSLHARHLQNATVTALRRDASRPYRHESWQASVYDSSGELVEESILRRRGKPLHAPGILGRPKVRQQRVLFAGTIVNGYGHFLLDGLSRLWWLHENSDPDLPIVWSAPEATFLARGRTKLRDYQRQILDVLGITNPVILLKRPTTFSEVIVPEQGFEIDSVFHTRHMRFLESGGFRHQPEPGLRVWLSRSKVSKTQTEGMEIVESELARNGWKIVHPQELPIREQLALLARCERIAGEEGSAFHSLIFLADCQRLHVDIFPRSGEILKTYWTIAERKGFSQKEHRDLAGDVLERSGRRVKKRVSAPERLLEVLLGT